MQLDPEMSPHAKTPFEPPKEGLAHWIQTNHAKLSLPDRWIVSRLQAAIESVDRGFSNFELNESAQALYEFTWHELCDWYIEFSKLPLREGGEARTHCLYTLHYVLETLFRTMHPIMPFVTEELWQSLPWKSAATSSARIEEGRPEIVTIMLQKFPTPVAALKDENAEKELTSLKSVIEGIRNFRGENSLSPKTEIKVQYAFSRESAKLIMDKYRSEICSLGKVGSLELAASGKKALATEALIAVSSLGLELFIDLQGLVDFDEEAKRVQKEIDKVLEDIAFIDNKLGKESFIARAPQELVEKERARKQELTAKLTEIQASLARLKSLSK
jgi:valyl-tRNA synthetase